MLLTCTSLDSMDVLHVTCTSPGSLNLPPITCTSLIRCTLASSHIPVEERVARDQQCDLSLVYWESLYIVRCKKPVLHMVKENTVPPAWSCPEYGLC